MQTTKLLIVSAAMFTFTVPLCGEISAEEPAQQTEPKAVAEGGAKTEARTQLAARAAEVLDEIMEKPDQGIPVDLLNRSECVAVFPSTLKAGFLVGAQYGYGLVSCRQPESDQWGAPAFFTLAGGSFGLQIGAKATDLILLVMNEEGMNSLLNAKITLGADLGVSAGPVGRDASAATDVTLQSAILSYSRSEGLFAGADLNGSVLNYDEEATQEVYGEAWGAKTVLMGNTETPAPLENFPRALKKYAPQRTPKE
jgi:lipid-binding SYLF domain-containing protein